MIRVCIVGLSLLFICLIFSPKTIHAADAPPCPIKVTLLTPANLASNTFWNDYALFMQTAASNLGIQLQIIEAASRTEMVSNAKTVLSGTSKPDYLMYIYYKLSTLDILAMGEKAGVKSIIINTDIVPSEKETIGRPRDKFIHWIGHIYPDDIKASSILTEKLLQQGKFLGLNAEDGNLHIVGIGANHDATSSTYRLEAFKRSIRLQSDTTLDRCVLAHWNRTIAHDKANQLMNIYPDAKIWWAIHDNTALGILDAAKEHQLIPGKDFVVGGIDWSAKGIQAVREGDMVATIGGHFMEGAWALIMALDFHNGHDFATPDATLQLPMCLIDQSTLPVYAPILDRNNWTKIDFKQFSKTYNSTLVAYDFSPDAVVRGIKIQ